METIVHIAGAGLAGSQAALYLARHGVHVRLYEMRPVVQTPVHHTDKCAELVCSNSFKSMKPDSAAGMLKQELSMLGSELYEIALTCSVAAGGALAVDREIFASSVTEAIASNPHIELIRKEITSIDELCSGCDAAILASGPLTGNALAESLIALTGSDHMSFYDAAAPIVMSDSLDMDILFSQSRYEDGVGDYLNAPFDKEQYERFIDALLEANRVIHKEFEAKDLFQACQPIEEIARTGRDAPRYGCMKPVGLTDPATGKRPWAALQLRAENAEATCYNLVGCQTNLTFGEQARVFRMIPGLEHAEFARYGVMHRNTFIEAPRLLSPTLRFKGNPDCLPQTPLFAAGQVSGTEGYVEAIRSGLHCGISVLAMLKGVEAPELPQESAFGALLAYACNPETQSYQPSHVNFGLMPPLPNKVKNKGERYLAYSQRGMQAFEAYHRALEANDLL